MRIKVISKDGSIYEHDISSFEFRSNNVSNWIRMKYDDGTGVDIHNIATIKCEDGGITKE